MTIILNSDQSAALSEIMTAYREKRARHLLTGYAGTGKTTLMQSVVTELRKEGARVEVEGEVDNKSFSISFGTPILRVRSYKVL
jgi:type II secretory pathway predicted ATPase ExeA